jgi:hypothetical protein
MFVANILFKLHNNFNKHGLLMALSDWNKDS